MRAAGLLLLLAIAGCSRKAEDKKTAGVSAPVKITQFYATVPKMEPGEKELLCYGVENATAVWLSPPRQQLIAALSRCIEVTPSATTEYRLTAEGASGDSVSQELTVTMGAPRAKILEVRVNTLTAKRGDTVSICFKVANTKSVSIDPIGFKARGAPGCATHQPKQTTTYVVTATGAGGENDQEKVTIKVQ